MLAAYPKSDKSAPAVTVSRAAYDYLVNPSKETPSRLVQRELESYAEGYQLCCQCNRAEARMHLRRVRGIFVLASNSVYASAHSRECKFFSNALPNAFPRIIQELGFEAVCNCLLDATGGYLCFQNPKPKPIFLRWPSIRAAVSRKYPFLEHRIKLGRGGDSEAVNLSKSNPGDWFALTAESEDLQDIKAPSQPRVTINQYRSGQVVNTRKEYIASLIVPLIITEPWQGAAVTSLFKALKPGQRLHNAKDYYGKNTRYACVMRTKGSTLETLLAVGTSEFVSRAQTDRPAGSVVVFLKGGQVTPVAEEEG